jgi:hypothetical protein
MCAAFCLLTCGGQVVGMEPGGTAGSRPAGGGLPACMPGVCAATSQRPASACRVRCLSGGRAQHGQRGGGGAASAGGAPPTSTHCARKGANLEKSEALRASTQACAAAAPGGGGGAGPGSCGPKAGGRQGPSHEPPAAAAPGCLPPPRPHPRPRRTPTPTPARPRTAYAELSSWATRCASSLGSAVART